MMMSQYCDVAAIVVTSVLYLFGIYQLGPYHDIMEFTYGPTWGHIVILWRQHAGPLGAISRCHGVAMRMWA